MTEISNYSISKKNKRIFETLDKVDGNKSDHIALAVSDWLFRVKMNTSKIVPPINADIPTWREHLNSLSNDEKIIEYNRISQLGRLIKERIIDGGR